MQSPPKPNNNNLFSFLMKREQGDRRIQERGSSIISDVTSRVAAMSQAAFDSAIAAATDKFGNAKLDFHIYIHNLSEITFKPGVTYIESRFIGATFKDKANLHGLNFQKADFSHAKLREANLREADLRGAILYEADLSSANLQNTNLNGANLKGANLTGSNLRFARLEGANLSRANLTGANLGYARLEGANLIGVDLGGANLTGTLLGDVNLSGVNLSGLNLTWAKFLNANLSNSDLTNAKISGADLTGANLSGADLTNAKIAGADFSKADLSGADFSGTLKASIIGRYYSDISATDVSKILNKLDDAQIEKMLGIGDEVPVKEYLKNLLTIQNEKRTIDSINKVIAVIIPFEEKIKSTTPSSNVQPSVGGKRKREESLGDGGSARKPEGR